MTLILGLRARDGVVVGSDRKMLRGFEVEYAPKYYVYEDMVAFFAVGLTGIVDDFYDLLSADIRSRKGMENLYEFKIVAEDIMYELTRRYAERVGEDMPASVVLAGLENLTYGKARMYYIHSRGYGEHLEFVCTGHGGPYALSLAKYLLDPSKDVVENGKRIAYIISWVGEEVDTTVGGKPDVLIIRDREGAPQSENEKIIEVLPSDVVDQITEKVKDDKSRLAELLGLA